MLQDQRKGAGVMIVLAFALLIGPWGCALKQPPGPQPPTDEVLGQLNTIGLPIARFAPETQLDAPTSGKGVGALKGAGIGIAAGASPGLVVLGSVGKGAEVCAAGRGLGVLVCGAAVAVGLGMTAVGGTVGALGGTVYGAVTAESGPKIDAAEAELKGAVIQADVQTKLRDEVLHAGRDRSALTFVALDAWHPGSTQEPMDYRTLAEGGVDTVLEVGVARIALRGQKSGINPPVAFSMTAQVQLVRTADGAATYGEQFDYHTGAVYTFLEWAAADSRLFREELDRGMRGLAADIARLIFPSPPARSREPAGRPEPPSVTNEVSAPPLVEPPAASTPATRPPTSSDPEEVAMARDGHSTPLDSERAAMLGTWLGSFRSEGVSRTDPARLRIFQEAGRLRWELTRAQGGEDLTASGTVSVAGATATLAGTYQPARGSVDVTLSLRRYGGSLAGSGQGFGNRVETLRLMRFSGE